MLSLGLVDLHFHGAFGIDLMTATAADLSHLAQDLAVNGVAAFCPTTLSSPAPQLRASVERLGIWIQKFEENQAHQTGAVPLGIHLEGPFISSHACGAHPPKSIRSFDRVELESLWKASRHHLKILTIAPESIGKPQDWDWLKHWSRKNKIVLSLGHSRATREQAQFAFQKGFSGVTHAWNAMAFHHRDPGILGAALGRPKTHVEIIIDGVHVSYEVIRMTRAAHLPSPLCMISDCTPAASTPAGSVHEFGPLRVRLKDGVSRLPNGALAGGGLLLTQSYGNWAKHEARRTGQALQKIIRETIKHVTVDPLLALGLPPSILRGRRVRWELLSSGNLGVTSLFGPKSSR